MIITCGKCKTKYRIDDNAIAKEEFKVRCTKCSHAFLVKKPSATSEVAPHIKRKAKATAANYKDNPNCKVITICNQKGGVAKTTTCLSLATALVQKNKRVLVVDFDIQSNLTLLLGHKDARSFFDVVDSESTSLSGFIIKTKYDLSLLPSNSKMALLSKTHMGQDNFEYMLRDKLLEVKGDYDYILIDTPPSGDFYTLNALLASTNAIVPAPCEYLSMNGINHIEGMIKVIQNKIRHFIDMSVLVTKFDKNNMVSQVVLDKIKSKYKSRVLKTMINNDQKIQEAEIVQTPVIIYDSESPAARQYMQLATEIEQKLFAVPATEKTGS
jgi:chromosome partitioning protein